MSKILGFEFFLTKLIDWHKVQNKVSSDSSFNQENNFSKLKVMKLYFFVISTDEDLIRESNFFALPYGHVESDIYNSFHTLQRFTINDSKTVVNDPYIDILLKSFEEPADIFEKLDTSINLLKTKNSRLINYTAFDLVELSHLWHSWKSTFNQAREQGKFSKAIDPQLIVTEPKFYSLG